MSSHEALSFDDDLVDEVDSDDIDPVLELKLQQKSYVEKRRAIEEHLAAREARKLLEDYNFDLD